MAFPFRTHVFHTFTCAILRWTRFICVKESLTLDSLRKLDSNHVDSEVIWGSSERVLKSIAGGGPRHGACACGERVRPIRFDQGIGAIDRKAGLPPAVDRRARTAPRSADPHHRLPDHDLPWRLRPGAGSEPAEAQGQ